MSSMDRVIQTPADVTPARAPRTTGRAQLSWRSAARIRNAAALLVLAGILTLTARPAAAAEPLSLQVQRQFAAFTRAAGAPADGECRLQRAPTWIQAAGDTWVFTADVAGNRSLRRMELDPRAAMVPYQATGPAGQNIWIPPGIRDGLIARTRRLAAELAKVQDAQGSVHLKREVLLICRLDKGEPQRFAGRYLVRLNDLPRGNYFQVVYGADRTPVRIDTNVWDWPCKHLAEAMLDPAHTTAVQTIRQARGPLAVGTFFDPDEDRYELRACSYEGADFLDLARVEAPATQPFVATGPGNVSHVAAFRQSQDYRYWCWRWWMRQGHVGAIRGNWDPNAGQWEYPDVKLLLHRSLAEYPLKGGQPRQTRRHPGRDGKQYDYPYARDAEFAPVFFEDLERCHVAVFCTHGGRLGRYPRYQLRRNLDVWVRFNPPAGLGGGNLRHLFFDTCGAMTHVTDPAGGLLLETWVRSGFINGVRTISGNDGTHYGQDRFGWRFFGRYNKGESISETWAMSQIDETPRNNPVTIAYGPTREAAIETLSTGRFHTGRAEPVWAAASLWNDPADIPGY